MSLLCRITICSGLIEMSKFLNNLSMTLVMWTWIRLLLAKKYEHSS